MLCTSSCHSTSDRCSDGWTAPQRVSGKTRLLQADGSGTADSLGSLCPLRRCTPRRAPVVQASEAGTVQGDADCLVQARKRGNKPSLIDQADRSGHDAGAHASYLWLRDGEVFIKLSFLDQESRR